MDRGLIFPTQDLTPPPGVLTRRPHELGVLLTLY